MSNQWDAMAHLDACDVGGKDSSTDVHSWVTYSTRNRLFISVCCISYTSLLSWLYLEFVDISYLQCQRIYIGTCHTEPGWGEVHTVLIIAHPRLKICIMVYHPQFVCKMIMPSAFFQSVAFYKNLSIINPKSVLGKNIPKNISISMTPAGSSVEKNAMYLGENVRHSLKSLSQ